MHHKFLQTNQTSMTVFILSEGLTEGINSNVLITIYIWFLFKYYLHCGKHCISIPLLRKEGWALHQWFLHINFPNGKWNLVIKGTTLDTQ